MSANDALVNSFRMERVMKEDPRAKSVNLLGTCVLDGVRAPAVLLMERAFFASSLIQTLVDGPQTAFSRLETIGNNDAFTWVLGWQQDREQSGAHSKLTLICPAGDEVVAKYGAVERRMILETPQLYKNVTLPWIQSIPRSKTQWVNNILDGSSEAESVLYRDDHPQMGFVIVPDLKWDRRTLSSLYLIGIVRDPSLTNLRELTRDHIPMLKKIKQAASAVATEKYGLKPPSKDGVESSLRCFLHYMPTFL
ncbi:5'-(N(7)-methyl 5'-triphosphoguanosine)-[mRNA] diphosphatase [Malassezia yamatoensis]|uniref:5'-(N(7)-methyl 5'-triphosphoguanosine)-[mRNA] diphosphatase n=1 Tax=Malassezia yamatoensis TaxID=253288 RepID=A0AAJ5YTQ1_9BASI|nr:5'-(N(7)-methyl 5'-triphosphoguanosine)-[mRNA] diphosphatase [Malassezia yamatoensis]